MVQKKRRIIQSFIYAFRGIYYTLKTQTNMKVHVICAILVAFLGYKLQLTEFEWLSVVLAIFMVVVAETINTAIEMNIDLVTKKLRPRAMIAKDIAAGAVLLASMGAIIIALIILSEKVKFIF